MGRRWFPMPSLMHHALEQAADRFGERDALLAGDRRWSFRELDDAADRFRTHLAARGVGPGDRVAVMTTNRPEFVEAVPTYGRSELPVAAGSDERESLLVFSSGTTGLPKAVRHTHRSMGHATEHWCQALGLGPDDRFQVATPPSHILGLLNLLAAASAGASVRLHARFDLDEVLRRIAAERMTLEMAVAPIALAMANHPHLEDIDLSSMRTIL